MCSAGRFGASCNQDCLPGSWCSNGQISNCPAGMTSQPGATSAADCGKPCTPMAKSLAAQLLVMHVHTLSTVLLAEACAHPVASLLPVHLFVPAVCIPGHGGQDCSRCAAGSFSAGVGREACITCPAGMTSIPGAPSPEYCQCNNPGQSKDCMTCPRGTWSAGTPVSPPSCLPCAENKTSDVGASSPDQCCKYLRHSFLWHCNCASSFEQSCC